MTAAETPSPDGPDARRELQERIAQIRKASFETTRRGYDKAQVKHYLEAVADWLEGLGLGDADRGEMRRELAWVGERTSEILTKAEETAGELRARGESEAAKLRSDAEEAAKRLRAEADEEARRLRLEAATESEETVAAAERRAEAIVAEATRRRQDLQVVIGDLLERRDEIVADGARLADELADLFAAAGGDFEDEPGEEVELEDDGDAYDYDEDGVRVPLSEEDPEPIARDPGETAESDALGEAEAPDPDTEERSTPAR